MRTSFVLALLLMVASLSTALADEGTSNRETVGPVGTVVLLGDQGVEVKAALDSAEFSLPANIGELIDDARKSADPADSWDIALALYMAEQASGQTSEHVTAAQLIAEATAKARAAGDAPGLLMAAEAHRYVGDDVAYDELMSEFEAASTEGGIGEKAGSYTFDLIIVNRSWEAADVYLDGSYQGYLYPGEYFYFEDLWTGTWYVYAVGWVTGDYWDFAIYGGPWDIIERGLVE